MKKILLVALLLFSFIAVSMAEEQNYLGLGFSLGYVSENAYIENRDIATSITAPGIGFLFLSTSDSGLTFSTEGAYTFFSSIQSSEGPITVNNGFMSHIRLFVGGAVINTQRNLLSIGGGLNWSLGLIGQTYYNILGVYFGPALAVQYLYKASDNIALYVSVDGIYNAYACTGIMYYATSSWTNGFTNSFVVIPSIGLSFKLPDTRKPKK